MPDKRGSMSDNNDSFPSSFPVPLLSPPFILFNIILFIYSLWDRMRRCRSLVLFVRQYWARQGQMIRFSRYFLFPHFFHIFLYSILLYCFLVFLAGCYLILEPTTEAQVHAQDFLAEDGVFSYSFLVMYLHHFILLNLNISIFSYV